MLKRLTFFLVWTSLTTAILYFFYLSGSETLTRIFLPVSFISIIVSFVHGPVISIFVVISGTIAGFLATGLPYLEFVLPTIIESIVAGLSARFLYRKTSNSYLALLVSFLTSKVALILIAYLFDVELKILMDLSMGLIGLGLQLIFIPMIYKILVKSFEIENQKGGI